MCIHSRAMLRASVFEVSFKVQYHNKNTQRESEAIISQTQPQLMENNNGNGNETKGGSHA